MANEFPKVSSCLHRIMVPVIFLFSGVMFLVVLTQVIFRYVLSHPLPWSEESARYLMIWVACLAASEAYAKGNHIGVTLITATVKPALRKIMTLAIHLIVAALCGFIAYQGFFLGFLLWEQVSPAMEIPMTFPYLAIPTGASLIFIQALALFFQKVREPPIQDSEACELK
ncbi:MAG: TRAP transporter small permease [Deltaproteobacteria bacterium]|nr:TRAP transporter small permease [Deltaproteobacteria bacterium]